MNIRNLPKDTFSLLSRAYKGSRTRTIIAGILILALIGFGVYALLPKGDSASDETTSSSTRSVELKSVAALSTNADDLAVVGIVQSQAEATVRTESSGQVTGVYRVLGDTVSAGSVIAEMDNATQRASVLSAQGGLQGAEAQLAKVKIGTRVEQIAILESASAAAHTGAVNTLLSAYSTIDDAVHHTADLMFSNADTNAPTFNLTVTDSQLSVDLKDQRVVMNTFISRESLRGDTLANTESSASLHDEIVRTEIEVRATRDFFDDLISALGKSVISSSVSASDISGWKSAASAARSTLSGALASLSAADTSLTTTDQNLALSASGATAEDIASAEAVVTQAQGGLASARAALEKTIIRAPISGTINMLTLTRGNFESAGTPVVTIANNGSLEVLAYVSEYDAQRLVVGGTVSIDETASGVITRIAPALDPVSKKIEVRIAIGNGKNLTNGQSVIVQFGGQKSEVTSNPKELIIPLSAIKIEVDSTTVFSVGTEGTLVAHPVELGALLGDRVVVKSGLTAKDVIVVDARGLKSGMLVNVK